MLTLRYAARGLSISTIPIMHSSELGEQIKARP